MQIRNSTQLQTDEEKRLKTCLKILIKYELKNPEITSQSIWDSAQKGQLTEQKLNLPQSLLDKWLNRIQEWLELKGGHADLSEIQDLVAQEKQRKEEAKQRRLKMIRKNREIVYCEQGHVCFVDFEYTAESPHELLSIGAVVMDKNHNRLGYFYQTIKPRLNSKLSHFTKKITKLEQKEIDGSPDFIEVVAGFLDFLQRYKVKQLYVWGDWDRLALRQNTSLYEYEGAFCDWICQMIDLQCIIVTDLPATNNQWGLEKMKMIYGIDTVVIHHALSDAIDLCDVFVATKEQKPNLEIATGFLEGTISLPKYTRAEQIQLVKERKSKVRAIYYMKNG